MVDSGIESSELSALEGAAADELDGMTPEEAELFIERLKAQADAEFPPERLSRLDDDLQKLGINLWIQRNALSPDFDVRNFLIAKGVMLPFNFLDDEFPSVRLIAVLKTVLMRLLRHRDRLVQYNTPEDAVDLIRNAKNIVVLTGAGISVSCGIPDFRSRDGIYASLEGKYGLDKPEDMFDKLAFMSNPNIFFDFAHTIFPSNFKPSASHRFVKLLQDKGKLLRNYTQNIDTLEQAAGISRVLQCHGSFATATCTNPLCSKRVDGSEIKAAIFAREVPMCPDCAARRAHKESKRRKKAKVSSNGSALWTDTGSDSEDDNPPGMGVLKPDITFFGEALSRQFDDLLEADRPVADLIIVAGTSLKVAPVAELLTFMPHRVPVIVINKTPIMHFQTDIMLLGSSDTVVTWLADKLGWEFPAPTPSKPVTGETSAAEREAEAMQAPDGLSKAEADEVLPVPQPVIEPTQWDGADYIWAWPDAELGILERMRARVVAEMEQPDGGSDEGDEGQSRSSDSGSVPFFPPEDEGGPAALHEDGEGPILSQEDAEGGGNSRKEEANNGKPVEEKQKGTGREGESQETGEVSRPRIGLQDPLPRADTDARLGTFP